MECAAPQNSWRLNTAETAWNIQCEIQVSSSFKLKAPLKTSFTGTGFTSAILQSVGSKSQTLRINWKHDKGTEHTNNLEFKKWKKLKEFKKHAISFKLFNVFPRHWLGNLDVGRNGGHGLHGPSCRTAWMTLFRCCKKIWIRQGYIHI
jgi:hypothetical protein